MSISIKNLLLGFALGILFSTFLYLFYLQRLSPADEAKTMPLSQEQIILEARKLGFIQPEEFLTPKDNNPLKEESTELNGQAEIKAEEKKAEALVEERKKEKEVEIVVKYKDTAESVGKQLEEKGLIPKAEDFIVLAKQKNAAKKLRVNKYNIREGASLEEILLLITTPPKK